MTRARSPKQVISDRRARLLRFIAPWAECRRQYVVSIGDCRVKHDMLTDEALESLAERICLDFWFERKINRQNRAIYARGLAA